MCSVENPICEEARLDKSQTFSHPRLVHTQSDSDVGMHEPRIRERLRLIADVLSSSPRACPVSARTRNRKLSVCRPIIHPLHVRSLAPACIRIQAVMHAVY